MHSLMSLSQETHTTSGAYGFIDSLAPVPSFLLSSLSFIKDASAFRTLLPVRNKKSIDLILDEFIDGRADAKPTAGIPTPIASESAKGKPS